MLAGVAIGVLGMFVTEPKQAVSKSTVSAAENFNIRCKECKEIEFIDLH
jgi:hypothetical protein